MISDTADTLRAWTMEFADEFMKGYGLITI